MIGHFRLYACLSVQPILKINKQNQAIYTIQQPIKIHLMSPKQQPMKCPIIPITSLPKPFLQHKC